MKRVISIVEDEKDINNLVAQYLRKEGYEVHSYYTYEEASAHVADDDVHLWILDIMLDDKSGFDLIEEIRLQGPETPVIFMSARDKEFDRIIGLEKGCDDYITKPFSPHEVMARVRAILRRIQRVEGKKQIFTCDNLTINLDDYIATIGAEALSLTKKELEIFWTLATHQGKVFSRDQLLDSLWGHDYYGDNRTVDSHIRRLRSKLDNYDHPQWEIKTIWGVGYKFEALS